MEITSNLKSVLDLLNASIVKRDNILYVYDGDSNTMERIDRNDDNYTFKIDREDGTYNFTYGYNGIIITRGNEQVRINSEGITYTYRKDNSRFNDNYVQINSLCVNFYKKDEIENGHIEDGIKAFTDLSYFKKSSTIQQNGDTFKEDIITKENENGEDVIEHMERKYNGYGKLVTGKIYQELLQVPVEVYVYDELANSNTMRSSFDKFNNFIPGIGYYAAKENEMLESVLNSKQKAVL